MRISGVLITSVVLATLMAVANTAAALTTVNSPFGTDAVIVMVAGDLPGSDPCHPGDNSTRGWRRYGVDGSLKSVPTPNPNNPSCELGNFVSPRVMYFDIEPGSPYFGGCAVQALGSTLWGGLSDDVLVKGSAKNDIFQPSFPVVCGGFYWQIETGNVLSGTPAWYQGRTLNFSGEGGDDLMTDPVQGSASTTTIFGGLGNDVLIRGWEFISFAGEGGNDRLRGTNGLFTGSDRFLNGGPGSDCFEDRGNSGSANFSRITCGEDAGGMDQDVVAQGSTSVFGNPAMKIEDMTNGITNCEQHTPAHCTALPLFFSCDTDSDCMSGGCSAPMFGQCLPQALLVVASIPLSSSDQKLLDALKGANFSNSDADARFKLNFVVRTKRDVDVTAADATGKAIVVISESVSSGNVNSKFAATSTPVLVLEPAIQGNMNMTGATWGTHQGSTTGTQLNVIGNPAGPHGLQLAAGLSGTSTVLSASGTLNWGIPAAGATVFAKVVNDPARATGYAYEKGTTMVSGTAPGKRAFLPFHANTVPNLTAVGWRLFDVAVRWAIAPTPGPIP